MATTLDEESRAALLKLECIKEIRTKVTSVERLRSRLANEVESVQNHEATLAEYRVEVEHLLQEKMAHVEELRQIHADINSMESIIKQCEELRSKSMDNARRLYEEYQPMKNETARLLALNLPRNVSLPTIINEEDPVPPNFFDKPGMDWPHESDDLSGPGPMPVVGPSSALGSLPSPLAGLPSLGGLGGSPSFLSPHQSTSISPMRSPQKVDQRPLPPPTGPPAPSFRQQPPPMKACLSCHQQIHRNAPICPLCKAKSRSRNPKKPKKKD